jgi:hypothetical protein
MCVCINTRIELRQTLASDGVGINSHGWCFRLRWIHRVLTTSAI